MITANPMLLEKARDSRHQVFEMSRTLLWSFIVYNRTNTPLTCYFGKKMLLLKLKKALVKVQKHNHQTYLWRLNNGRSMRIFSTECRRNWQTTGSTADYEELKILFGFPLKRCAEGPSAEFIESIWISCWKHLSATGTTSACGRQWYCKYRQRQPVQQTS